MAQDYVTTRVASLHWINMLHEKDPAETNRHIAELLPALLKTISDSADEVLDCILYTCHNGSYFEVVNLTH